MGLQNRKKEDRRLKEAGYENGTFVFRSHFEELQKLYLIVMQQDGGDFISKEYLREKIGAALVGTPIVLHPRLLEELIALDESLRNSEGRL